MSLEARLHLMLTLGACLAAVVLGVVLILTRR
jgi:hypothetical protein